MILNAYDDPQTVEFMGCQVEVDEPRFTAKGGVVYRNGHPITTDVAWGVLAALQIDPWEGAPALAREVSTAIMNAIAQRAQPRVRG